MRATPPAQRAIWGPTDPLTLRDLRAEYELAYAVLWWAANWGLAGPDFYRLATGYGNLRPGGWP